MAKPTVWFVDDLPENREKFEQAHSKDFSIQSFESPSQVLDMLCKSDPPDALLCDIYYYDSDDKAREIEKKIQQEAQHLNMVADSIGADRDKNQKGISLIENVNRHFNGKVPFPVYAYTAKGPYIMQTSGFDRICRTGAKWLFKGRQDPETIRWVINSDIRDYKTSKFRKVCARYLWAFLTATGILGWFIGKLLESILSSG